MNISHVGNGKVVLLSGGGKVYTDIAARFCRSEKGLEDIISSPYDANIIKNILDSGHLAATEFDYFIFGVEGYSRVTEIQLVRKRLASYLIKSGRVDKGGRRSYDLVIPEVLWNNQYDLSIRLPISKMTNDGAHVFSQSSTDGYIDISLDHYFHIGEDLYNEGIERNIREEDLRYLKPQATEFKGIIGMNAHSLIDWFKIRCCQNAQTEIRDMANKMLLLCKEAAPDLFKDAGASCVSLGYCPENGRQNQKCIGKIIKKEDALKILHRYSRNGVLREV